MKRCNLVLLFASALLFTSISACSHYEALQKDPKESSKGDDESHNEGQNCGSCHNINGHEAVREAGWWTVSGTVFKEGDDKGDDNAIVELWEKPGRAGKLIKKLETDKEGNFYTNQILNFMGGCYPVIYTPGGQVKVMPIPYTGGSCNSCHGVSTSKLELK
jgi:hypothetical protein